VFYVKQEHTNVLQIVSGTEKINKILILCDFPIRNLITSYYTTKKSVNPLNQYEEIPVTAKKCEGNQ
jgi:hypothetical protein